MVLIDIKMAMWANLSKFDDPTSKDRVRIEKNP